jgi:hypothetical protein
MSACERCWADSGRDPYQSHAEAYQRLLEERGPNGCTPEQQAGPGAKPCPDCGGRLVRHQHTGECMANISHAPPRRAPPGERKEGKP